MPIALFLHDLTLWAAHLANADDVTNDFIWRWRRVGCCCWPPSPISSGGRGTSVGFAAVSWFEFLHFDLAKTPSHLDRNEKAAKRFQTALTLKPDDVEALTNYSSLLRRMNQHL